MVFWDPIPFPARALLLDENEFAALFPNGFEKAKAGIALVGLEATYPSANLINYHYLDIQDGGSRVLDYLNTYLSSWDGFTPAYWENSGVWARLDELVAPYLPATEENRKLMTYHYGMVDHYDPRSPGYLAY